MRVVSLQGLFVIRYKAPPLTFDTSAVDCGLFHLVKICAQVKIQGQNEEMLLAACEQFLSKSDDEIQQVKLVGIINRDCDELDRDGYSKGKDDDDDDDGNDDAGGP